MNYKINVQEYIRTYCQNWQPPSCLDDLQSELHKKQECLERSGDQIQQLTHELLTLQQQVLHYERELEQSREELDKNKVIVLF